MSCAPAGELRQTALDMPAARWRRLEALLASALELPAGAARSAFLDRECSAGATFRGELDSLLAAHDAVGPLDRPVAWRAGRLAPPLPPEPAPGTVVSHYELQERLGSGGTGVVYRARDLRLGRTVALKFLAVAARDDACARRRFREEARAAAALEHANVCAVYEIGETVEGRPFIAMALVDGPTLRRLIERGPFSVGQAVDIARQVAAALACAHGHGIVHRDVKPGNVIVARDGVVKLVDFSVATRAGANACVPAGTVAYMSPEQVRGEDVDHRTDLWALGVVLYEMLAGRRPFAAGADGRGLRDVPTGEPPALRALRADVPVALERVVARALERDRGRRFQSAAELADELAGVDGAPVRSVPGPAGHRPYARTASRRRPCAPAAPRPADRRGLAPRAALQLLLVGVPVLGITAALARRRRG